MKSRPSIYLDVPPDIYIQLREEAEKRQIISFYPTNSDGEFPESVKAHWVSEGQPVEVSKGFYVVPERN